MSLNFNVPPYYDDFDSTKNFYRILFKPGSAVQARELTQSQSILQDQITKFGTGIYKDGSKISGANIHIDTKITTVKLTSASQDNLSNYSDLFVVGQTSNFIAQVVDIDVNNFYLKTKPANIANGQNFSSGETLNFYNTRVEALSSLNTSISPRYTDVVKTSTTLTRNASGTYLDKNLSITTYGVTVGDTISIDSISYNATVTAITDSNTLVLSVSLPQDITNATAVITNQVSVKALEIGVDEGVWFTNGFFVRNNSDSIIPDALNAFPSVVIGFEVDEIEVDSYTDSSLLDPAVGASNYQAPGADRYQILLRLVTKPYVSDQTVSNLTTLKFIELVRINSGIVEDVNTVPIFSSITDQIAKAVYDQAGDFIVNPYSILIGNSPTTSDTTSASISAGKVYLNGTPVEHIAQTGYTLNKAREINATTYQDTTTYYGNYTKIKNLKSSIPNFQLGTKVELHNVAFGSASSSTKIGTARARNFSYDSGTGVDTHQRMYLYDVKLTNTNGQTFANVASLVVPNSGNYSSPTFSANTVSLAPLVDNNYDTLVFPLQQQNISNVSSVNYVTQRYYTSQTFNNGSVTINTNGSNETFVGAVGGVVPTIERQINYMVMTQSTSGSYSVGTFIPMDQANVTISVNNSGTPQATVNIGGSFSGTGTIVATISVTNDTIRNKVLNANNATLVSANTMGVPIDIGVSDVYKFHGVYEIGNTAAWQGNWSSSYSYANNDVVQYADGNVYISLAGSNLNHQPNTATSSWSVVPNQIFNYTTDNGQKDEYYDHGTITNISGVAKGNVVVSYDYFTHSGGSGCFTVNSYTVDYADIPEFTSPQYGTTYNLRDVVDFRPRRNDGIGQTEFNGTTYQLPAPLNNTFLSYGYYLGRTDKVVLYPNGQFKTITGISSYINPTTPSDIPGALTLFTLNYPPYTFDKKDIVVTPNSTRRYTMRDIGVLDKRISNLEYYTSLSLLENQVTGSDVTDSTGANILFKNGFLVDGFKGSGVADVNNPDYNASIDPTAQLMRPPFVSNVDKYGLDVGQGGFTSAGIKQNNYWTLNDNLITFSYGTKSMVYQVVATETVNVNPFNVINFVGNVKLSPSSDVWYDTQSQPNINIVNEDQAAWIAAVNGTGNGTQWNDWQLNWTGQDTVTTNDQSQISRDTQSITNAIVSKGLSGAVSGGNIQISSTTKAISNAVIPFARTVPVSFTIQGMPPLTKIHTFLDGVCVDSYVTPSAGSTTSLSNITIYNSGAGYTNGTNLPIISVAGNAKVPAVVTANVSGGHIVSVNIVQGGSGYTSVPTLRVTGSNTQMAILTTDLSSFAGDQLTTDANGSCSGVIEIPNDEFIKIPTGTITVEFGDNFITPSVGNAYAKATFFAQGTLDTTQTTVVSTRPPQVTPKTKVAAPATYNATNDALNPGSSTYVVGSAKQNNYINAYVNNILQNYTGNATATLDYNTVVDVYNNRILPVLQDNLPSSLSTPTGSMALAAVTMVMNYFLQNKQTSTALDDAIANLTTICRNNRATLDQAAINYLQDPAIASEYASAHAAADKSCSSGLDPLSQNFTVDPKLYPNGVFLESVGLFFATKDSSIPVNVRIRPTVNGYPDSINDIPGTIVYKNPEDINVPASGDIKSSIGNETVFEFKHPVFLKPGEYSLMVQANSNQYTLYASKFGDPEYGTGNIVNQVNYTGSLFKSQNSSTWIPSGGETLAFIMNICEFAGGTTSFDFVSQAITEIDYDIVCLTNNDLSFNKLDSIDYQVLTRNLSDNSQLITPIVPNQNYNFNTRQKISSAGDLKIRVNMTNTDKWTSPVVDLERLNTILVTNQISPWLSTANTVSESSGGYNSGTAVAKYISRRVTMNNNFDSSGLTVFMDVNRQPGTKIEVYYKVLNGIDKNSFDNQPYVLMNPILSPGSGVSYTGTKDWTSDTYQALNITYNDITTGVTYNNFKTFAIKVVMYSSNPSLVPQIKNFRAIATA